MRQITHLGSGRSKIQFQTVWLLRLSVGHPFLFFTSKIYSFNHRPHFESSHLCSKALASTQPHSCPSSVLGMCSQALGSGLPSLVMWHHPEISWNLVPHTRVSASCLVTNPRPRPRGGSLAGQGLVSSSAAYLVGALNKRLNSLRLKDAMCIFGNICKVPDMN